jgi:hypothetical protein
MEDGNCQLADNRRGCGACKLNLLLSCVFLNCSTLLLCYLQMVPGRIIGGSGVHVDRLLLDDDPVFSIASGGSVYAAQPSAPSLPTPPRDGGRALGSRDPRSDIFGNIPRPRSVSRLTFHRVYSTANAIFRSIK